MESRTLKAQEFIDYSKYGLSFLGHGKASELRTEEIPKSIKEKQKINTWFKKTTKDSIIVHHSDNGYESDYSFLKTDKFILMEECLIFVEHNDRLFVFKIEEHKTNELNLNLLYTDNKLL